MEWRKRCQRICAYLAVFRLFLMKRCMAAGENKRVSLTISAAASLQETLGEVETLYRFGHTTVDFRKQPRFAGESLARGEIEQGAPVDVFISAAAKPMDDLEGRGLITTGTRQNLVHNSLVLIMLDSKPADCSVW